MNAAGPVMGAATPIVRVVPHDTSAEPADDVRAGDLVEPKATDATAATATASTAATRYFFMCCPPPQSLAMDETCFPVIRLPRRRARRDLRTDGTSRRSA